MLRVGIIGATGYTGAELIKIFLRHKDVRITYLARSEDKGERIEEVFPYLKNVLSKDCGPIRLDRIREDCDLVFLSLPHTVSMSYVPAILKANKRVIDLSADYRFKDPNFYFRLYRVKHKDPLNLKKAVYGLPELNKVRVKGASLVANPGCYSTAAILALAPLIANSLVNPDSIVVDAKSGISGAGKKATLEYSFVESNENFKAYKVGCHQHTPEINQVLSKLAVDKISVTFVPHLLPLNRGIFVTAYAVLKKKIDSSALNRLYRKFYKLEPFVRILEKESLPELKNAINSNFCDIAVRTLPERKSVVVLAAIDNLLKGAAGQAVQNMNIMYGLPETEGLI